MSEKHNKSNAAVATVASAAAKEPVAAQNEVVTETPNVETPTAAVNVVAETPKPAVTAPLLKKETVTKKTAVMERRFKLVKQPSMAFKGRQRQITIELLKLADRPVTADEMVPEADKLGYSAQAGTKASIAWHLHHLVLMGYVECVNPNSTIEIERPFTPAEAMALSK